MKKLLLESIPWRKVFLIGTVINFIAVPFTFSQAQFLSEKASNFTQIGKDQVFGVPIHYIEGNGKLFFDSTKKQDTTFIPKKNETPFHMKKEPWKAILFSIIPGGGQFYNESYWKVPILFGLSAYFGYSYYDEDKKFRSYRDQYSASQTLLSPDGDPNLKSLREFYRNQRDNFLWYFIIVYFVGFVDAYVDAHLFDFDVKEEKLNTFGKVDRTYNLRFHLNF